MGTQDANNFLAFLFLTVCYLSISFQFIIPFIIISTPIIECLLWLKDITKEYLSSLVLCYCT